MAIVIDFLCIAAVCVFVVDVSGFTQSWRGALKRWLGVRELVPLHPFDCSLCCTVWACLIYGWAHVRLTPVLLLAIAAAALLTPAIGEAYTLLRTFLVAVLSLLTRITEKLYNYGNK